MKKTIISISAAALCASALSVQAFAMEITKDKSIYVSNPEEFARSSKIIEWEDEEIFIDPNTVMPVYESDIFDYARTGIFNFKRQIDGNNAQRYVADAVNKDGDYSGLLLFPVKDGVPAFGSLTHQTDKSKSAAFEPNARRLNAVMTKRGIRTDCKDVKLIFVNGLGYVYYIDNGTSKYLAASNLSAANGNLFNDENGGIVEIGDELKAFADKELAEHEEWLKYLATLPPGENAPTGGNEPPQYMVDNTPYLDGTDTPSTPAGKPDNPYTGSDTSKHTTVLAVELGLVSAMIIGGAVVGKKRKNER